MPEPPEANTNTGGNANAVTVSEAAQRLGLTLPRLQRLLKRPEFAGHVSQGVRQTKTGTRTVTLVSVSVLDGIQRWAEEQKHEQSGANRYRSDGQTTGGLPAVLYQQRIADLEAMNAELRADKERLYQILETAQANLAREQALRALPPPQAIEPEGPPEAVGGPQTGAGDVAGTQTPPEASEGPKRGFWARLWAWGKD